MTARAEAWSIHPTYNQLVDVLDTLNAGIFVRTEAGRLVFGNDRLLHWLGYTARELEQLDVRALIPEELRPSIEEEFEEIHSGDERLRIGVMRRKDGRTMPIVFCPHVLRKRDAIAWVVTVVMDLGEVQTAKRVGSTSADGLGDRLGRIAQEIHTISLFAGAPAVADVPPDHEALARLSPREREILGELMSGARVPAIARKLFISPHTVRNHLKSMYRKLDVGDQASLIEHVRGLRSSTGRLPAG